MNIVFMIQGRCIYEWAGVGVVTACIRPIQFQDRQNLSIERQCRHELLITDSWQVFGAGDSAFFNSIAPYSW